MAIKGNPKDFLQNTNFIFIEDSIVLKKNTLNLPIDNSSLPDRDFCLKIIKAQTASDWFEEEDKNYSAIVLEKDTPLPPEYYTVPLREFFWISKTIQEQNNALPSKLGALSARAMGLCKWRASTKYCPSCAQGLYDDPKFTARVCLKCKKQIFPRIEPAVIVLVKKENKILLVKHTYRNQNVFTCVAGFVEIGETLEECVHREVKEETGLEIKNLKYCGSQGWPYPDQLMCAFYAEYKSGQIKIQEDEIAQADFFSIDNLPKTPKAGSVAYNLINNLFKNFTGTL